MNDPPAPTPPPPMTEYTTDAGLRWRAAGALAVGLLMVAAILIRFAFLIVSATAASSRPAADDNGFSSGAIGGLGAAAFFFIAYGVSVLRRPVRARLTPHHLLVEGFASRRVVPWTAVAQIRRDKKTETLGQETVDVVTLLDEKGKRLARLTGSFARFPMLVAEVEARTAAARGAPAYDRAADLARKAAAQRRSRWKLAAACLAFTLLGLAAVGWGTYEWWVQRRLARDGVDAAATIDRHYMVSVTGWIDFTFTDPATGRQISRKTSIDKDAWEALTGKKTVTVRYVPSKPDWNKAAGESGRGGSPLILVGAGAALTLLFGTLSVFTALGYSDISLKDGKIRVKRFGDVDDALESKPPAAPYPPQFPPAFPQAHPYVAAPAYYPNPYAYGSAPAPPPPPAGFGQGPPATHERPFGITVIATLNIVLGVLGAAVNGLRLWMQCVYPGNPINLGRGTFVVHSSPAAMAWVAADLVLALALIVSAIGLLRMKRWGVRLAVAVAALQVLSSVADGASTAWVASQELAGLVGDDRARAVAAVTGRLLGAVLGAAYPLVVLVVLGRRAARDPFNHADVGQ